PPTNPAGRSAPAVPPRKCDAPRRDQSHHSAATRRPPVARMRRGVPPPADWRRTSRRRARNRLDGWMAWRASRLRGGGFRAMVVTPFVNSPCPRQAATCRGFIMLTVVWTRTNLVTAFSVGGHLWDLRNRYPTAQCC